MLVRILARSIDTRSKHGPRPGRSSARRSRNTSITLEGSRTLDFLEAPAPGSVLGEGDAPAMARPRKYSDESRERAVRFYFESDRPIAHVARDLGIHKEALRQWVRQAEADQGRRPELLTTNEREELRRLRKEVAELRRANAILKDASVYFATELDPTRLRCPQDLEGAAPARPRRRPRPGRPRHAPARDRRQVARPQEADDDPRRGRRREGTRPAATRLRRLGAEREVGLRHHLPQDLERRPLPGLGARLLQPDDRRLAAGDAHAHRARARRARDGQRPPPARRGADRA